MSLTTMSKAEFLADAGINPELDNAEIVGVLSERLRVTMLKLVLAEAEIRGMTVEDICGINVRTNQRPGLLSLGDLQDMLQAVQEIPRRGQP